MTSMSNQKVQLTNDESLVIELVGPAGAGKSTLYKFLCQSREPYVQVETPTTIECVRQLSRMAWRVFQPAHLWGYRKDRFFSWAEIRSMLYLCAWPQSLQNLNYLRRVAVFDHGPIYRLAALREFGPRELRYRSMQQWWQRSFEVWGKQLSLLVWLDAPNETLLERIRERTQPHACKSLEEQKAFGILNRYRDALGDVIAAMQVSHDLPVLRMASDKQSVEIMAGLVRDEILKFTPEVNDPQSM